MEELLFELVEIIMCNIIECGINTYNIVETKEGIEQQYRMDLTAIEVYNETVMFVNSNDEVVKCFLVESVEEIAFNADPEWYKILFNSGKQMTITPVI